MTTFLAPYLLIITASVSFHGGITLASMPFATLAACEAAIPRVREAYLLTVREPVVLAERRAVQGVCVATGAGQ